MKPERVDVEARIMQAVDRAEAAAHYDAFSILADTLRAVAAERDAAERKLAQLEGRRCEAPYDNHGAPKVSGPEGGPVDFTEPGVERGDEGRRFAP